MAAAKGARIELGVRAAKDRLSEVLRRVRAGATVTITDRGHVVAEIRPARSAPASARDRMVRDGHLVPARRPYDAKLARDVRVRLPAGTATRLIDADRDERR